MSPPGYPVPVKEASRCGNERQEGMVGEKAVREEGKKRHYKSLSLKFDHQAVLAIDCELISIVSRKRLGWH